MGAQNALPAFAAVCIEHGHFGLLQISGSKEIALEEYIPVGDPDGVVSNRVV
jgi:hypothetical protein